MPSDPDPDPDPWTVLGVAPGADAERLRAAHRAAVRRHHPDLHPGDAAAERAMRQVNRAWAALGGDAGVAGRSGPWWDPSWEADGDDVVEPIVLAPLGQRGLGPIVLVLAIVILLLVALAGDPARFRRPDAGSPTSPTSSIERP